MRRKFLTISSLLMAALLSGSVLGGCQVPKKILEDAVRDDLGQSDNDVYQQYLNLNQQSALNENGYYNALDHLNKPERTEGTVRVTLAENRFLKVNFYRDAEFKKPIEGNTFYMNPGDSLYCEQPTEANPYTALYAFSHFMIYDFSAEGGPVLLAESDGSTLVYTIPDDYAGEELAVFPVGEFRARRITFNAYYRDANGRVQYVPGDWNVNGTRCPDNTYEVTPGDSYTVEFVYDASNYYFDSSSPAAFNTAKAGYVQFKKASSLDDISSYTVRLKRYANFRFDIASKVLADGTTCTVDGVNRDDFPPMNLMKNQKIVIVVKDSYHVYLDGKEVDTSEALSGGKRRYTILVPDSNRIDYHYYITRSVRTVTLSDRDDYGDVTFKLNGSVISADKITLKEEDVLTIDYRLTNADYKFVKTSSNPIEFITNWWFDLTDPNHVSREISAKELSEGDTVTRDAYISIQKRR